jgi:hypothetical protein
MENYKITLIQNNQKMDITNNIDAINWTSDLDTLSTHLSFNIANTQIETKAELGNQIILTNKSKLVFSGVVTNLSVNKDFTTIDCNDYAWYLNKSKAFIQFKKISVTDAIKRLCSKFNIQADSILTMNTIVSKIYTDETISEIMLDLLGEYTKETSIKVRMEMLNSKFRVYAVKDEIINPVHSIAENIAPVNCFGNIGIEWSITKSIEDMINSVQIVNGNKISFIKDDNNIGIYGLLQESISVENTDVSKARNEANMMLKERNIIPENLSVVVLGSNDIIAGRCVVIGGDVKGKYLITSCGHTLNTASYLCNVTLKKAVD